MRFVLCLLMIFPCICSAGQLSVATASNFKPTLELLVATFEEESEHQVNIISASSGILYAQISHGAPFDIFLSANEEYPLSLIHI